LRRQRRCKTARARWQGSRIGWSHASFRSSDDRSRWPSSSRQARRRRGRRTNSPPAARVSWSAQRASVSSSIRSPVSRGAGNNGGSTPGRVVGVGDRGSSESGGCWRVNRQEARTPAPRRQRRCGRRWRHHCRRGGGGGIPDVARTLFRIAIDNIGSRPKCRAFVPALARSDHAREIGPTASCRACPSGPRAIDQRTRRPPEFRWARSSLRLGAAAPRSMPARLRHRFLARPCARTGHSVQVSATADAVGRSGFTRTTTLIRSGLGRRHDRSHAGAPARRGQGHALS
jgi:hypothetical protein